MPRPPASVVLLLLLCLAATKPSTKPATRPAMDYGPFLSYSVITADKKEIALKGINIRVGPDQKHTICFDTDLLRFAAAWKDGFLDLSKTHQIDLKGSLPPAVQGTLVFSAPIVLGVSATNDFADPRPDQMGPLPHHIARYNGLYIHGEKVILSYTFGDAKILECPSFSNDTFIRQFQIIPGPQTRGMNLFSIAALELHPTRELARLTKGGPPRYHPLTTRGTLGDDKLAYTVDTLTIPEKNPWNAWIRPTGLDFFPDGRVAICTLNGDVWIISNIDEKLENLTWRRFATGLYEPLGLVIKDEKIYVRGRDQITRLHDLNADGEADFYENFNNDGAIDSGYHAFCYDLQLDSRGNFYYARGGHWYLPGRRDTNALFRLSPDGLKTDIIATGFRAPNGIGIGRGDQIFTSDNQGNWMPTSKINLVQSGKFYGFVADPKYTTKDTPMPATFEPPLCWIPIELDNSSGGQCFVSDPRFGPLSNHLFHTSYGKSSLFLVLIDTDSKIPQGGVVQLPLKFDSGIMRARVNPKDGQLYLAGPKGWQTNGARDGALQRIRFTNKPAHMPTALRIKKDAIEITFTDPLDRTTATDTDNYSIEHWNYRWSAEYGSKDYLPSNPNKTGRDTLDIKRATLSPDHKTIILHLPNLKPVMQMKIEMNLKSASGVPISTTIHNTINSVD